MKKFFVILFFLPFFGCTYSPFKEQYKEKGKIIWNHNNTNKVYEENLEIVFVKVKEAIKDNGQEIKNEYIEKGSAGVETRTLKITLEEIQKNLIEATIKANSLKNKELAEKVMKEITIKINSVEYNKQGKAVN